MKDGTYGAGARRVDGVWQLPMTDLAEVIDPTPTTPPLPILGRLQGDTPKKRSRRRGIHGRSVMFIRQGQFWADVLRAMGLDVEAEAIRQDAEDVLRGLRGEYRASRAARSRAGLLEAVHTAEKSGGSDRPC